MSAQEPTKRWETVKWWDKKFLLLNIHSRNAFPPTMLTKNTLMMTAALKNSSLLNIFKL